MWLPAQSAAPAARVAATTLWVAFKREPRARLPPLDSIVLAGILLSLLGILFCGCAGALRECAVGSSPAGYSFKLGVPLDIVAGVLSAWSPSSVGEEQTPKFSVESFNADRPFGPASRDDQRIGIGAERDDRLAAVGRVDFGVDFRNDGME